MNVSAVLVWFWFAGALAYSHYQSNVNSSERTISISHENGVSGGNTIGTNNPDSFFLDLQLFPRLAV